MVHGNYRLYLTTLNLSYYKHDSKVYEGNFFSFADKRNNSFSSRG